MPNIFKGFETSNPKEVAKELKIKRASTAADILAVLKAKKNFGISPQQIKNEELWNEDFDRVDIRVGVRGKNANGDVFIIEKIENEYAKLVYEDMEVFVDLQTMTEMERSFLVKDISHYNNFGVSDENINNPDLWIKPENINPDIIEEGDRVCRGKNIGFVDEIEDGSHFASMNIQRTNGEYNRLHPDDRFYILDLNCNQIDDYLQMPNEDIQNDKKWTSNYQPQFIKPGIRVRRKNDKVGGFLYIPGNKYNDNEGEESLRVYYKDGTSAWFKGNKHQIYAQDMYNYQEIRQSELRDADYWEFIGDNMEFDFLHHVIQFDSKNKLDILHGNVIGINKDGIVSIMLPMGEVREYHRGDFKDNFLKKKDIETQHRIPEDDVPF